MNPIEPGTSLPEPTNVADLTRGILNILEDTVDERIRLTGAQRAMLNILEDTVEERTRLADSQRAVLNILDDFDAKNREIARINNEMAVEIAVRKRTEEALTATNKELEAFSYSVSHDLRAPLRTIDGFSLALLEDCSDKLDTEGKDYLRRIRGATNRMALLIDELLKLARISRGEMTMEQIDLSAMVTAIVEELREADPQRKVEVVIQDGITVDGDEHSLRAALENLLGNAWKFTGKTEHARIEFGASATNGHRVYFIRDNGAGFDMKYAQKLFGVFQRLHSDAEFPGVGVGLAIVQRVIHRHGGQIWAEGAISKGATFRFTLHDEHGGHDEQQETNSAGGR